MLVKLFTLPAQLQKKTLHQFLMADTCGCSTCQISTDLVCLVLLAASESLIGVTEKFGVQLVITR